VKTVALRGSVLYGSHNVVRRVTWEIMGFFLDPEINRQGTLMVLTKSATVW
jgi:hypothetical protein